MPREPASVPAANAMVLAALLVGAGLGIVTLAGATLVLYTGEGLLDAVGFLVALSLVSVSAGVWVGLRDGSPTVVRGRWTVAVMAFAAAAIFAQAWHFPAVRALGAPARLLVSVFLIAEPGYAAGALIAALHAAWAPARPRGFPPAAAGLAGAALGALAAAVYVVPRAPLGTTALLVALAVAGAGLVVNARMMEGGGRHMSERAVVITGVGDRGQVGYALAEAFVALGARVLITDVQEGVGGLAAELGERVVAVRADLTLEEDAERVAATAEQRLGGIDVLVNVAGGLSVIAPVAETGAASWRREIERNATTAHLMTRAALPRLRARGGAIVNFASPAAERGAARLGAYSAAKAAVVALTRATALEEAARGVRANAIAPGMIDTRQNRESVEDPSAVDWVSREEIASLVLFLAGEESAGVSGQVIEVSGRGGRE